MRCVSQWINIMPSKRPNLTLDQLNSTFGGKFRQGRGIGRVSGQYSDLVRLFCLEKRLDNSCSLGTSASNDKYSLAFHDCDEFD